MNAAVVHLHDRFTTGRAESWIFHTMKQITPKPSEVNSLPTTQQDEPEPETGEPEYKFIMGDVVVKPRGLFLSPWDTW